MSNIPGQTQTLPSAVYAFLQVPGAEGSALRLVVISIVIAMSALLAAYLLAECWYGATIAMLQGALPQRVWGTAQGSLNVVQVVANLSPLLIGALHARGAPLRQLLSVFVPGAYMVTAFCFWRASSPDLMRCP